MGAWIETTKIPKPAGDSIVAPFMGAWIETLLYLYKDYSP